MATGSATAGYFSGGINEPTQLSLTEKLVYSTDVMSYLPSANLTTPSSGTTATCNLDSGYIVKGNSGNILSSFNKLDFTTDTVSERSVTMSVARYALSATGPRSDATSNTSNIV